LISSSSCGGGINHQSSTTATGRAYKVSSIEAAAATAKQTQRISSKSEDAKYNFFLIWLI